MAGLRVAMARERVTASRRRGPRGTIGGGGRRRRRYRGPRWPTMPTSGYRRYVS